VDDDGGEDAEMERGAAWLLTIFAFFYSEYWGLFEFDPL